MKLTSWGRVENNNVDANYDDGIDDTDLICHHSHRNDHIDDIEQACEPQNYDPLTHPLISVDTRATSVVMIMLIIMILMKKNWPELLPMWSPLWGGRLWRGTPLLLLLCLLWKGMRMMNDDAGVIGDIGDIGVIGDIGDITTWREDGGGKAEMRPSQCCQPLQVVYETCDYTLNLAKRENFPFTFTVL